MKSLVISKKFLLSMLAIIIAISSFGCAEQKPFKPLPANRQRVEKAPFMADGNARFIFGETVTKVPVENTEIDTNPDFPGHQGYASRMIRFEFSEKYLNIIEITTYTQSAISNPGNATGSERIISRYPIEKHVDIRKKLDDYNDKTNIQEETEELGPWNTRKYAIINFGNEEIIDRGIFIEQYGDLLQDGTLKQKAMGDLQELYLGADVLNITVRKALLNSGTSTIPSGNIVEVRYSFLPEPKTTYKPMDYPLAWEKRVGFFRTEIVENDKYGNRVFKSYINRWDPVKPITFYLSDNWNNDDVKQYKPVAYQAIAEWNKVLKDSTGISNFITLKESDGTQRMGDLRYNMIQWIDESFNSSPLGYGPSTAHPETGEIINANLFVYGGALRQSILAMMKREDITPDNDSSFTSVISDAISSVKQYLGSDPDSIQGPIKLTALKDQMLSKNVSRNTKILNSAAKIGDIKATFQISKDLAIKSIKETKNYALINKEMGCVYPMPYDKISDSVAQGMSEGEIARDILIGTMVHEMGHNLGLRHNFRGSVDKNNFYNDADGDDLMEALRDDKGDIVRDTHGHPVMIEKMQSSSVMDYEYNFEHELDRPGKYDAAAIKTCYQTNKTLKTKKVTQGTKVIDVIDGEFNYQFCTDHQVLDDALCLRFDRGTTAAQITDNLAKEYHRFYKVNNIPYVKKYDTRETYNAYLSKIVGRYFMPARVIIDYRNKRYFDLKYDEDISEVDNVDDFISKNKNTTNPEILKKLNACIEIKDLNDAVINSYKLFTSAMYNDKEDLDEFDEYNGELKIIGYLYDRLYSTLFLSLESAGSFGLNYRSVTRYPDLFDQKYFKDRNLSSFEFYRNFSYAPGGWFAKYDYATGTFATKENSNELDKSNLFYFLLRPYVYELLLSEMNGLGSSSDLYSVIKTETANGDSSAIINQKGAIAFKKFNKEMGTQFKGGLIQSKYYAAQLQTTLNFFDAMVSVIPLIDISGGDPAIIALNNRVLNYKNKVTAYQNRTDLFAAKLDVYENPEDYNTLYNYFVESEDALFDMDSLISKFFNVIEIDGTPYLDPESISVDLYVNGFLTFDDILGIYAMINEFYRVSGNEIVNMYLNFLKIPGAGEGLFNDDKISMVYDEMRGKLITTPVGSIITNEVSMNHHKFKGNEFMLQRFLDFATSPDPVESEKGAKMLKTFGVKLNELPGIIDSYRNYVDMDRDMLYKMSDIYRQFAPGSSW